MSLSPRSALLINSLTSLPLTRSQGAILVFVFEFAMLFFPVCSLMLECRALMGDAGSAAFPLTKYAASAQ